MGPAPPGKRRNVASSSGFGGGNCGATIGWDVTGADESTAAEVACAVREDAPDRLAVLLEPGDEGGGTLTAAGRLHLGEALLRVQASHGLS